MDLASLFSFKGRATRAQFWGTQLAALGALVLLVGAGLLLVLPSVLMGKVFGLIVLLLVLLPASLTVSWTTWAVSVKRAHDRGHSGWITLLFLVPLVSLGFFIYLGAAQGDLSANEYGEPLLP